MRALPRLALRAPSALPFTNATSLAVDRADSASTSRSELVFLTKAASRQTWCACPKSKRCARPSSNRPGSLPAQEKAVPRSPFLAYRAYSCVRGSFAGSTAANCRAGLEIGRLRQFWGWNRADLGFRWLKPLQRGSWVRLFAGFAVFSRKPTSKVPRKPFSARSKPPSPQKCRARHFSLRQRSTESIIRRAA